MTAGLVCVGIALLCWPTRPRGSAAASRAWQRMPSSVGRVGGRGRAGAVTAAVVVVLMALGGSAAGALVLAVLIGTAAVLVRWSAADRRHRRDLVELAATLRMLSRELRAGASAEQAVSACVTATGAGRPAGRPAAGADRSRRLPASAHPPPGPPPLLDRGHPVRGSRSATVQVLQELVLPGDPSDDRDAPPGRRPVARGSDERRPGRRASDRPRRPRPVDDLVVRLVGGWRLAMRCGLPLTGLVEGVAAVAQERLDAVDARRAEVAGPRLSGWVLAALPAMGLLLGSGMGVDPLAVLLAPTGPGPALLVVGVALTCAGLVWSARLVRR